jgi:hypothetical protein
MDDCAGEDQQQFTRPTDRLIVTHSEFAHKDFPIDEIRGEAIHVRPSTDASLQLKLDCRQLLYKVLYENSERDILAATFCRKWKYTINICLE